MVAPLATMLSKVYSNILLIGAKLLAKCDENAVFC